MDVEVNELIGLEKSKYPRNGFQTENSFLRKEPFTQITFASYNEVLLIKHLY